VCHRCPERSFDPDMSVYQKRQSVLVHWPCKTDLPLPRRDTFAPVDRESPVSPGQLLQAALGSVPQGDKSS
jgi:hypothetical protein